MTTKKEREAQKIEAIASLRQDLSPGDHVHTVLTNCSRSGMSRTIKCLIVGYTSEGTQTIRDISWLTARATGYGMSKTRDGVVVGGCGMDMGFALVYNLARALWPDGAYCTGKKNCPSNDHRNGDRIYRKTHKHSDGGYSLKQVWA